VNEEDWTGGEPFGPHDPGSHLDPTSLGGPADPGYGDLYHHPYYHHPSGMDDLAGPHDSGVAAEPAGLGDAGPDHPEPGDVAPLEEPGSAGEPNLADQHGPFEHSDPPSCPDHPVTLPQPLDTSPFPPHLEVDVVPSDGLAWIDPHLLGGPESVAVPDLGAVAALHDLQATEGADPTRSDDPAIRALARFWAGPA
jgi:hypothetical protein